MKLSMKLSLNMSQNPTLNPKCPFNYIPGHLGALCAAALAARVEAEDLAAEDALRLPVAQTAPLHHLHALHQPPAIWNVHINSPLYLCGQKIYFFYKHCRISELRTTKQRLREKEMGLQIRLVTPVYAAGFG